MKEKYDLSGWLLIQDIAGYTAFSEGLRKKGKEGIEKLTEILNRFLSEQETVIEESGGYIFKLAGDAFFAALPPLQVKNMEDIAHNLLQNNTLEKHALKSRVVAVRGDFSLHGIPVSHNTDFLPVGNIVNTLMYLEDKAEGGDVLIKKEACGSFEFKRPDVLAKIKVSDIMVTYRPEVVAFVRLGKKDTKSVKKISSYILDEMPFAFLSKVMPYKDGVMLVVFFGFPKSTGKEKDLAVIFSLKLRAFLESLNMDFGIGTSYDFVYRGVVGGKHFRELTFIGDGINTAARLATLGKGGTLFTFSIIKGLENKYDFRKLRRVKLKGKSKGMVVYFVVGKVLQGIEENFVDRKEEYAVLKRVAAERKRVIIKGEAGMGKSKLLFKILKDIPENKIIFVKGVPNQPPLASFKMALECLPGDIIENYPVLNDLRHKKNIHGQEAEMLLHVFFKDAVAHADRELLIIDDLHWVDATSLKVFIRFLEDSDIGMIATVRSEYALVQDMNNFNVLSLTSLSLEYANELLETLLKSQVSSEFLSTVYERSFGIPFLIEQFAGYIKDKGLVVSKNNVLDLKKGAAFEIPMDAFNLVLARYDLLPENERKLITVASCMGNEWNFEEVKEVLGKNFEPLLSTALKLGFLRHEGNGKYVFSHSLLRETIYAAILGKRRMYIHRKIARVFKNNKHESYEIAVHYERGRAYKKADAYFEEAFFNLIEMGFHRESEEIISHVKGDYLKEYLRAYLLHHYGKYRNAEKLLKKLLRYRKRRRRIELLLLLSSVYDFWAKYELMEKTLRRLGSYESYMDAKQMYAYAVQWGIFYDMTGDHDKALKYYFQSLEKAIGNWEKANSLYNIGWIYFSQNKHEKARVYFQKSLKTNPDNRMTVGWTLLRLGQIEFAERNFAKAKAYFDEAFHNFYISGYWFGMEICINPIVSYYILMHDYSGFLKFYKKVMDAINPSGYETIALLFGFKFFGKEQMFEEIISSFSDELKDEVNIIELSLKGKLNEAYEKCREHKFKFKWCMNLEGLMEKKDVSFMGSRLLLKVLHYGIEDKEREQLNDIVRYYAYIPLNAILIEMLKDNGIIY